MRRVSGATVSIQGFTLVEVMVALTILSLVMMVTVTGLSTLANTQSAIERMTSRVDEVRSVSVFLRDLLASATSGADPNALTLGGSPDSQSYFISGTDFLELDATVLFGERYGGTYLVRIAKEDDQLVLRWQESNGGLAPKDWNDKYSRVIVAQLEEFEVLTREDYRKDWIENRRVDTSKPFLVMLKVKAAGRNWPDLIVRVKH
ncbi:MAG: prepilin-type N-terminal cleavage/methylation domain-containing protein [Halioglobus sp.]|nr:prepilin-type N-terminal cleavage/methylation domain-containing protein [Halioglobus sp.]